MMKCYFEDGKHFAHLRHTVVDGLIIEKGKILLIRRSNKSFEFPGKIAIPGGYIDRDETVEQAVLREVLEETGYQAKIVKFLKFVDDPKRTKRQTISFIYVLKPLKKVSEPDGEIAEILWFDLKKLPPKSEFAFDHYKIIKDFAKSKIKI